MKIEVLASGSSGNAYVLDNGISRLLLECGIPFRELQIKTGFSLTGMAGCLISHEHLDHAKAAFNLMLAGIDIYCSKGTSEALDICGHRGHIIEAGKRYFVGASWRVMPFEVEHDAAEPLGFLIASGKEKILYATDTYYIRHRFRGLTRIMLECNYAADILADNLDSDDVSPGLEKRIRSSHMELGTVLEFLKANDLSRVRQIHLLHLSSANSDAARFVREIQETTGKPVMVA